MEENLQNNKQIKAHAFAYQEYDNYPAIEVPYTSAIPRDYEGLMGVPISFWISIARSSLGLLVSLTLGIVLVLELKSTRNRITRHREVLTVAPHLLLLMGATSPRMCVFLSKGSS